MGIHTSCNCDILWDQTLGVGLGDSSRDDMLMRASGFHTDSTITLSANNTTAQENIYQITDSIEIISIQGEITDATTLTNCTDVALQLWDGTIAVPITKESPGAVLSGFNVGAFLIKDEIAATLLTVVNNDQCRSTEASSNKQFQSFTVTQKTGTDTFIRLRYTTTDAPINAQIEWHIIWKPVNGGTLVAV